ncbi:class I SAM-dependent methyltransferase [Nocardioides daphniae]|uniref:Methyltransferase n=2 Tax=Nocardioides daphniae TaxID=402297 RepID=A0A4P7UBY0_9ACTN|nr:methyltransferase domain-containing protein [Nocardioides daphniae]QCC77011.1 methyltransferase domain-containing protein [Nocardioides daphniae]GGD18635.1 methyltransferase [Nocardioides daphniae]
MSVSERRSAARSSVVWGALESVLDGAEGRQVLDIGGGTGGFAVRVAALGHRVTVVDPSPDALAALARRAEEGGVDVAGLQGELSSLESLVEPDSVDVVLCHGVLEVVPDPEQALAALARVLRPGGTLSVVVAQRHAAVLARAMAGHFQQALELLDGDASRGDGARPRHRFTADEISDLVAGAGFTVGPLHAIRVFADLVPGSLVDLEPGAGGALVELEKAVADRPEYLPLAAQVHLLATR